MIKHSLRLVISKKYIKLKKNYLYTQHQLKSVPNEELIFCGQHSTNWTEDTTGLTPPTVGKDKLSLFLVEKCVFFFCL